MASLHYFWCQGLATHTSSTHHEHANHTTSMRHPQAVYMPLTCLHMPPHTKHTPSICHSQAICMPLVYLLHAICITHTGYKVFPCHPSPAMCHAHTRAHTHTHSRLAIHCAHHPLPDENQAPDQDPKDIGEAESCPDLAPGHLIPMKTCSSPPWPNQLLTFAGATLPGNDLPADATGFHLLEGLHLKVVSLGGLQVLGLWDKRYSDQAWAED